MTTSATLRRYIHMGPNWHYEIHKSYNSEIFSELRIMDHFILTSRIFRVFETRQDEADWLSKKGY